ncbi:unnamed protein product [Rhizophagus irregularis]|nr:unnamed protein product [Rhizophagus irregularis]
MILCSKRPQREIQQNRKLYGYEISCEWPTDPAHPNTWVKYNNSVAVAAYMDDTAFIETSKELFKLTITITENKVYLGDSHNGIIRVTSEEVRYLGVFLAAKGPDY